MALLLRDLKAEGIFLGDITSEHTNGATYKFWWHPPSETTFFIPKGDKSLNNAGRWKIPALKTSAEQIPGGPVAQGYRLYLKFIQIESTPINEVF